MLVGVLQPNRRLPDGFAGDRDRQRSVANNAGAKLDAVHKLHYQKESAARLGGVVSPHDVGMVETRRDLHLMMKAVNGVRIGLIADRPRSAWRDRLLELPVILADGVSTF